MRKRTPTPEILTTEKFEVKITKEEIAEIAIVELEIKLENRIKQIAVREQELSTLSSEKNSTLLSAKKDLIANDPYIVKVKETLELCFTDVHVGVGATRYSTNCRANAHITFKANQTDNNLNIYVSEQIQEEIAKLEEAYDKEQNVIGEELQRLREERTSLNREQANFPKYQRRIKASLTKKALSTTEEGKDILTLLSGVLPSDILALAQPKKIS